MSRVIRRGAAVPAALALLAAPSAAAAVQDPIPVGPDAYFTAQVNGVSAQAVVKVACPGPVTAGSLGHPVSGQTVEVFRIVPPSTGSVGYTGSAASEIDALFGPSSSTVNAPVVLRDFFAPVAIPTTLWLPCGGTGTVSFVPMPTSPTAQSATVTVAYVNIAV